MSYSFRLNVSGGLSPESLLASIPSVAEVSVVGRWPGTRWIEVSLRGPTDGASDVGMSGPGLESAATEIRQIAPTRSSKLVYLLPVLNGSVSFGLGSLLMLVALDRAGLAVAFVLSNTMLFWISILSITFLKERLTLKTALGVVAMVVGVIFVVL